MRSTQSALVVFFASASARSLGLRDYVYVPMPCAVSGKDATTSYLYTSSDDNYPACSAACLSRSDCTGLSIDDNQCKLYSIPIESAYDWDPDSNTTFWDIRCETEYVQCAAPGYQADWDDFWWSANMTLEGCKAECKQAEEYCVSYSFGNGECSLYEIPVSGSVDPGDESPYLFYDALCDAVGPVDNGTAVSAVSVPTVTTVTSTASNLVAVATNTVSSNEGDAGPSAAAVTSVAARDHLVARQKTTTTTKKTTTTTTKKAKTTVSYSERVVTPSTKSSSSKTTTSASTAADTVRLIAAVVATKPSTTTTTTSTKSSTTTTTTTTTTTKPTTTTTTTTTTTKPTTTPTTIPTTTITTSTTKSLVSLLSTTTSKTTTSAGKTTKIRMTVDWGAQGQFIKTIGPQQSQQAGVID